MKLKWNPYSILVGRAEALINAKDAEIEALRKQVAEMEEALERIENACDNLAAARSRELYLAMVEAGMSEAMLNLDEARLAARAARGKE